MLAIPLLPPPAMVGTRLLNALLRREDWARNRLMAYSGKTVRLALGRTTVSLSITHDGFLQSSDPAVQADVILTMPDDKLPSLPSLLASGDLNQVSGLIHVQGEAGLANVVSELARSLRWDYEDDLARLLGDGPALRLIDLSRRLFQGARSTGDKLLANTSEFLVQESGLLASQAARQQWVGQLNVLSARLDSLGKRVSRLEAKP